MYFYALLNENNICHTILQSSKLRDDIIDSNLILSEYDEKYLNSRWIPEKSEWEFPPYQNYIWVNGEWKDVNYTVLDFNRKIRMIEEIWSYLDNTYSDEQERISVKENLEQLYGFPFSQNQIDVDDVSIKTLEDMLNHFQLDIP